MRWNHRLAVFSVVLAVGAVASVATTQLLVGGFRDAAQRLEADATRSAQLRDQMAEHANLGHSVIEGDHNGQGRLAALEASIRADLARATGSAHNSIERRLLRQAGTRWQQGVAQIESYDRSAPVETPTEAHQRLAYASAEAARLIDEAASAGRAAERSELARTERFAKYAIAAMAAMAALVLASILRLGRQLGVEVLRPVARLRDSADRLGAGDLDHRAAVDRDDEFGELAERFNAMADAIACTHRVLTHQAHHDSLTGLANRVAFRSCLDTALSRPQRRAGTQAVVLIDLDDFKDINDTLGHAAGDELLAVVGARLADAVRPGDVAARLGGDEFALFLDGLADATAAHTVAERAVAAIAGPAEVAGSTVHIAASAGVTLRGEIADPGELMRQADMAMYLAKRRGKNRVERYDAGVDAAIADRNQLRTDLGAAAGRGELFVEYQPIVDLASAAIIAVEALVRWQHPTRGRLAAPEFVALADETDAIVAIGAWVLDAAAAQL